MLSVGGMDLTSTSVELLHRVGTLEKILDHILKKTGYGVINQQDYERYRSQSLQELQQRYPELGIQRN